MTSISEQATRKGKTRFFQVRKLPQILQPNSFYFVENLEVGAFEGWLTNKLGKKKPIGNVSLITTVVDTNPLTLNTVENYRSDYHNLYSYSGFLLNGNPVIRRFKDSIEETAENVTDLETDWNNRLTLTYN